MMGFAGPRIFSVLKVAGLVELGLLEGSMFHPMLEETIFDKRDEIQIMKDMTLVGQ